MFYTTQRKVVLTFQIIDIIMEVINDQIIDVEYLGDLFI